MDDYGKGDDLNELLSRWVMALANAENSRFAQEIDPLTGEPAQVSLQFTPKEEITKPYRMPCLFLGFAAPGTVFEISGAKLYEVK